MPIVIEKARLNLWNLIGFAIGIAVTSFGWGFTYNTMVNANAKASDRIEQINSEIKDIKKELPVIQQLQFQTKQIGDLTIENRAALSASNVQLSNRIDKVVETFGGKLDTIADNVNKVATRVEVIGSKISNNLNK